MQHVSPFLRYLAIPAELGPITGLRWAKNGEAIENHDGKTFIFAKMLPPFLEGFSAQRPLIHFGYVLDLLRLLGHSDEPVEGIPRRLSTSIREAFRSAGTSLRNAGAFFATLCKEVPPAWLSGMDGRTLAKWLAAMPVYPAHEGWQNVGSPLLELASFRTMIADALKEFSEKDLFHWFRFGRGPLQEEGSRLAHEVVEVKPLAFRGTLEDLHRERPRLAGALPLVGAMIGALSLPPRRRQPPELPLGGYADVTNRGEPERLLPSQFALDPDEFIRRFAEKELLFFRREEPHVRTREQLVLLLDQGVRTWGVVRLALGAAVLAFRKLAQRRKLPFQIQFGGNDPARIDPAACDLPKLADRLEASDLSASPADLIHAEVQETKVDDADVVLLTHPRSLLDARVKEAAEQLPRSKRLFALSVDEDGAAQFSQVRGGEAVPISRFRVDFRATEVPPVPLPPDGSLWDGDVEPVPFPFPIEPFHKIAALGFSAESSHLLVAAHKGYLHLWTIEGGKLETLPRAFHQGQALTQPQAVMGVRGGFVVGGQLGGETVAAHYDLPSRHVRLHRLGPIGSGASTWYGFANLHAVAVRQVAVCRGLDLATGAMYAEPERSAQTNPNAQCAYLWALENPLPAPWIQVIPGQASETMDRLRTPWVEIPREPGAILLHFEGGTQVLPMIEDGNPVQIPRDPCRAQYSRSVLAFLSVRSVATERFVWRFFDVSGNDVLIGMNALTQCDPDRCLLSFDGELFARATSHSEVIVREVCTGGINRLITPVARIHSNLNVQLGKSSMNLVIGAKRHHVSWKEGPLIHRFERYPRDETLDGTIVLDKRGSRHPDTDYDPARFVSIASKDFDVFIDAAGQVIVFDPHRHRLVCIFYVRRHQFAAWMPDGTRYGPSDITGQPATPDALERLGAALREAASPVRA